MSFLTAELQRTIESIPVQFVELYENEKVAPVLRQITMGLVGLGKDKFMDFLDLLFFHDTELYIYSWTDILDRQASLSLRTVDEENELHLAEMGLTSLEDELYQQILSELIHTTAGTRPIGRIIVDVLPHLDAHPLRNKQPEILVMLELDLLGKAVRSLFHYAHGLNPSGGYSKTFHAAAYAYWPEEGYYPA